MRVCELLVDFGDVDVPGIEYVADELMWVSAETRGQHPRCPGCDIPRRQKQSFKKGGGWAPLVN